jgi:hypothetical protein
VINQCQLGPQSPTKLPRCSITVEPSPMRSQSTGSRYARAASQISLVILASCLCTLIPTNPSRSTASCIIACARPQSHVRKRIYRTYLGGCVRCGPILDLPQHNWSGRRQGARFYLFRSGGSAQILFKRQAAHPTAKSTHPPCQHGGDNQ